MSARRIVRFNVDGYPYLPIDFYFRHAGAIWAFWTMDAPPIHAGMAVLVSPSNDRDVLTVRTIETLSQSSELIGYAERWVLA